jgi:dephospho-CoA kinase
MLVIGVAGMRAAGKTTVNEVAKDMGINSMEMRSIVVDMMKEKGIEITNRSLREFADDLRKREGYDVVARKMIERINGTKERALVVNGIRGYEELKRFREAFGDEFVLIGVFAPQKMRFERVMNRSLPEDPKSWDEFVTTSAPPPATAMKSNPFSWAPSTRSRAAPSSPAGTPA